MGKMKQRPSLHRKIIAAVYELSNIGVLASSEGIVHLLQGSPAARDYGSLVTFSRLSSLSMRRGKAAINKLIEAGVISSSYIRKGEGSFLSLDESFRKEADEYLSLLSGKEKRARKPKIEFIER